MESGIYRDIMKEVLQNAVPSGRDQADVHEN
jgi:hypothetical protein